MSATMMAGTPAAPSAHFHRGAPTELHQARRAAAVLGLAEGLTGRALDYGAGWGDLTARLAPQFDEIVGVDTDPERVAFAQSEYAPLQFTLCPAERTDFADGAFDAVFSIVVVPFVPSPEAYFTECRRLVKPGGALVVMLQNPDSLWMTIRRWRGQRVHGWRWGGVNRSEIRRILARHGFLAEAESGFYDPAFDRVRNPGDVALSLLNAFGHHVGWQGKWSYVGFRCRRLP